MKYFFKKHSILSAMLFYLLFIIALFFFVARPLMFGIKSKNNEIQEKISEQESKKEKLVEIPAFRSQFEMIQREEGKINVLLSEENIVKLIEKIENISEETNNKIKIEVTEDQANKKSSQKSKKEKESLISDLPSDKYIKMSIMLSGSYKNFLDFVKKMENMEYYSDIVSFKIIKEKENYFSQTSDPSLEEELANEIKKNLEEKNNISSIMEAVFYLEKK